MDNNEEIYDAEIISESVVTDEEYNGRVIEEPSDYWKLVAFHPQEEPRSEEIVCGCRGKMCDECLDKYGIEK